MIIKKIKNIVDLRDNLITQYENIAENKLDIKKSKEMSNAAGKILSSVKVQLENNKLNKIKKPIAFLTEEPE